MPRDGKRCAFWRLPVVIVAGGTVVLAARSVGAAAKVMATPRGTPVAWIGWSDACPAPLKPFPEP